MSSSYIRNPKAYYAAVRRNRARMGKSYRSYRAAGGGGQQMQAMPYQQQSVLGPLAALLGGAFMGPQGAMIGGQLGSIAGSLLGFKQQRKAKSYRSYRGSMRSKAKAPTVFRAKTKAGKFSYRSVKSKTSPGGDGVRLSHREFIGDVTASQGFINTSYPINPGLQGTFPWLSAIAQNFEQYQLHSLCFTFKTTSVDALNSTNTALGVVGMTGEYNVLNDPFINQQQFENNVGTVVTKPSLTAEWCIDVRAFQTPVETLYIRLGTPESGDLRLYDVCNFQLMVQGMQDHGFQIGQLFVTYDVSLFKPKLSSGLNLGGLTAQFLINPQANVGGITDSFPLGQASRPGVPTSQLPLFNEAGIQIVVSGMGTTPDTIQWPLGSNGLFRYTYRVHTYNAAPTAFSGTLAIPSLVYHNCQRTQIWQNYTFPSIDNISAGMPLAITTQDCDWVWSEVINISDPSVQASITFTPGSGFVFGPIAGNISQGDLIIGQINGNLPLVPSISLDLMTRASRGGSAAALDLEKAIELVLAKRDNRSRLPQKAQLEELKDDDDDGFVTSPPVSRRGPPPPSAKSSKKT